MKFASLFSLTLLFVFYASSCNNDTPHGVRLYYEQNQSLDYAQAIAAYEKLAGHYPEARLLEMGPADSGKPLHLFMISSDGDFDPASIKRTGKSIVLVVNGIHAGEPAGIDASVSYAIDLLENRNGMAKVLDNTVLAIIPVYNIGGALNRSPWYRLNQDGPEEKGSRRNARNLDLNRDFAKQDSQNARSFAAIYHFLDPDVVVDTHTTNGADHQYTMTLIPTMHQKMPRPMGEFFDNTMLPVLYERMNAETPWGMVPYVQTLRRGEGRSGITAFNDHPYYSSGYASLFNSFAFITETLVYKPFADRVRATRDFMGFLMEFVSENSAGINRLRSQAVEHTKATTHFVLDWAIDTSRTRPLHFRGYEREQAVSPLTYRVVNRYNHNRPWADTIPHYAYFTPILGVDAPRAYLIPQAWDEVISRLELNGAEIARLEKDTLIEVEVYRIEAHQTSARPNQGRQTVSNAQLKRETLHRQFYRGDALVSMDQRSNNYIAHMLEPLAPASFFSWGFFNSVLEDGEWFSLYAFEDKAYEMLQEDPELRELFEDLKAADPGFARDPLAQLQFLWDRFVPPSGHPPHGIYPVARMLR